jgi:Concanavalin A-like lectin/glucanases superfamily
LHPTRRAVGSIPRRSKCPALPARASRGPAGAFCFCEPRAARDITQRDVQGPRGVLRRPTRWKEIYVSSCKSVRQAHARHAATLPAGRHVDLRFCGGFRRQTRPPVPKPSAAAKPSPADSCRVPPRLPAATECRAGAPASGLWNAALGHSRHRHGRITRPGGFAVRTSVAAYRRTRSGSLFQRRRVGRHQAWRAGGHRGRARAEARAEGSPARRGGFSRWFNGQIDDVRIYNRALSVAEIKQLYNAGR